MLVANVGDSQAFLLRKGQALGLSTPHRVYGSGKGGSTRLQEAVRPLAFSPRCGSETQRERERECSSPPRPGLRLQSIRV